MLDDNHDQARRLIEGLNAAELEILVAMLNGMSASEIVAQLNMGREEFELARASMMRKLNARTSADAVRIALTARLDRPD